MKQDKNQTKQVKSYLYRLIVGIVIAIVIILLGIDVDSESINILFTVYGIVFSVIMSFVASFNTREVRNMEIRTKILGIINSMTKWTFIDFITVALLFSATMVISKWQDQAMLAHINIFNISLTSFANATAFTVTLILLCLTAYKFIQLRKLHNKIEDELIK